MPKKQNVVTLRPQEREELESMLKGGKARARELTHARLLLKADQGWTDEEISEALEIGVATCERVRRRFCQEGLAAAMHPKEQARRKQPRLDGTAEARLCALACSAPPDGRDRWTLELLADQLVRLKVVDSISTETVRRGLKKTRSSRGSRRSGV